MSKELKPCPFCGGKAGRVHSTQYDECFSVICQQCGIIIGSYEQNKSGKWENLFFKSPEEAVRAWNRRSNE